MIEPIKETVSPLVITFSQYFNANIVTNQQKIAEVRVIQAPGQALSLN